MLDPGDKRRDDTGCRRERHSGLGASGDGPWRRLRENSMLFAIYDHAARIFAYFSPYLAHT